MTLRDKYKALVAAGVSFVGAVAAMRLGMNIPIDQITPWLTSAIVGATSYWLTWLVPNMQD